MHNDPEDIDDSLSARGLHAKIFMGLRRSGRSTDVIVGSANFTDPAFDNRNVEATVSFSGPASLFHAFHRDFVRGGSDLGLLRPYDTFASGDQATDDEDKESQLALDEARSRIATGYFQLKFGSEQDCILVTFRPKLDLPAGVDGTCAALGSEVSVPLLPLLGGGEGGLASPAEVPSDFLSVTLKHGKLCLSFLAVARSNLDHRARARNLQRRVVSSPEDLVLLVGRLMGAPDPPDIVSPPPPHGQQIGRKIARGTRRLGDGLLEVLLLKGTADDEAISSIDEAIEDCEDANSPTLNGFLSLWKSFKRAKRQADAD
jgi:hypothetical protein